MKGFWQSLKIGLIGMALAFVIILIVYAAALRS